VAFVWLINISLVIICVIAVTNWLAFEWFVGSAAEGALVEIIFFACFLYLAFAGWCLLGWPGRIRASYFSLRGSPKWRMTTAIAIPILISGLMFIMATGVFLANAEATAALRRRSDQLFQLVDKNGDGRLNFQEFETYMLDVISPDQSATLTPALADQFASLFAQADEDDNGYLSPYDTSSALLIYLKPSRFHLALAFMSLSVVSGLFALIFALWFRHFELKDLETLLPAAPPGGPKQLLLSHPDATAERVTPYVIGV